MSLDATGSGGTGTTGGFAASGVQAVRCDGAEIQPTDRVLMAPAGTYVTGYTANQNAANGCVTLADDYYDAAQRSWTGGRNFLGNNALAYASYVGNGTNNTIIAGSSYSAIVGGLNNAINGTATTANFIGGGNSNVISSSAYHTISGGISNRILGSAYNSILGGSNNVFTATASAYNVGGGVNNTLSAGQSHVLFGQGNQITGGSYNLVAGVNNVMAGGSWFALGQNNQVLGGNYGGIWGFNNFANGTYLTVSGVNNGTLAAPITGNGRWDGNANAGGGTYLDVSGQSHNVTGSYNAVHGLGSIVSSSYNTVGGYNHRVSQFGNAAFGYNQTVTANRSIGVGESNTVGGGDSNAVFGRGNVVAGRWTSLVAGESNNVNGQYVGIIGGYFNAVAANTHVVTALGQQNNISATVGLVNGGAAAIGFGNELRSGLTPVAIGYQNIVSGNYTVAIGRGITSLVSDAVIVAGAGQRLGFYGTASVGRATLPAAATSPATTQTLVNAIRTALINLGLVA